LPVFLGPDIGGDLVLLGEGNDTAVWAVGDDNDTIEVQARRRQRHL
jgi:hypothetical protein